ncbi:hypothetical protein [Poseidonocella sp. HB161398]|uniref:hypothetical protein n=1 Tax=Poseidonocella sp. HB161398 TaxID=2320855 RepID=UPI00110916BC|nr:hypothetical protein [Poseidonocella sp. HB161398]
MKNYSAEFEAKRSLQATKWPAALSKPVENSGVHLRMTTIRKRQAIDVMNGVYSRKAGAKQTELQGFHSEQFRRLNRSPPFSER